MTDRAKKVMSFARQAAQKFNHDYIGTEHILIGLAEEGGGIAATALASLGLNVEKIHHEVEKIVKTGRTMVIEAQLPFTPRAKKVLELSMEEASALSHDYIGTEHLLLGLIRAKNRTLRQVLTSNNVELEDARLEVMAWLKESDRPDDGLSPDGLRTTRRLVWTHWYESGQKQSEGTYEKRKRQGHWTFWNEDGSIDEASTGSYEDGELTGD